MRQFTQVLVVILCSLMSTFSFAFLNMRMTLDTKVSYKNLGDSDLKVSNVCLGTMTFGEQNTESEGIEQLNIAFDDYGVNFLDTAEMYPVPTKAESQGKTDKIIGKWLKTRDRSKVILATKVSGASPRITWLPGRNGQGSRVTYDEIIASVDYSLERLQTDYIDLLQIHWPDRYVPIFGQSSYEYSLERDYISFEEQNRAMDYLIQCGKVRYFGVSNETPYGVMKFSQTANTFGLRKLISIQNSYSLINRCIFEGSLSEVCSPRHENVGLLAYSPLAGGILTGKYADPNCPKTSRLNLFEGYMSRYKESIVQEAVTEYCKVATKYNYTPTELALLWCKVQPHVTSTIIGATTTKQLHENLNCFSDSKVIHPEALKDIANIYKRYRDPSLM